MKLNFENGKFRQQLVLSLLKILMKLVQCIKSDNIEIMMGSEIDDIIIELFDSLLQKYQEGLEKLMRESEFNFDSVNLLYYHLQKISLKRGGSYADSPKWLKNKKATINPKNDDDDNCFQYALTIALNRKKIGKDPQRILKIKPFIGLYNWKNINFPLYSKDWKTSYKTIRQLLLISYLCHAILKK